MSRDEILAILKSQKSYLEEKYGVQKIGLFGSYARDEATSESDIDIYVELKENSFRGLASLWNYLDDMYDGIKVDMVNKHRHSKGAIFDCIRKEAIYI